MTDGQTPPAGVFMPTTVVPATALETITRAEIESQIGTARRYRRSIQDCQARALAMATADQETAASCSYLLPGRGSDGKPIEGPSIRLAEICISTWGNLRAGARLIDEDDKTITAQGFCHDLENNVAITLEVRRKITNRHGTRYSDDMVNVTANAALAIALRNVTFRVIPQVYVEKIRLAAVRVAAGDETTLATRRTAAVAHFKSLGVSTERLLAHLSAATETPKTAIEDITLKDLEGLHGMATAVRDGFATVDDLFPAAAPEPEKTKTAKVLDEVKDRRKRRDATTSPPQPPGPKPAAEPAAQEPATPQPAPLPPQHISAAQLASLRFAIADFARARNEHHTVTQQKIIDRIGRAYSKDKLDDLTDEEAQAVLDWMGEPGDFA